MNVPQAYAIRDARTFPEHTDVGVTLVMLGILRPSVAMVRSEVNLSRDKETMISTV